MQGSVEELCHEAVQGGEKTPDTHTKQAQLRAGVSEELGDLLVQRERPPLASGPAAPLLRSQLTDLPLGGGLMSERLIADCGAAACWERWKAQIYSCGT
uniref:Uncharacterized protein n=1 Tax=Knipowitschia caucasica TaxID=637954 RepID=A0AAV2LJ19_KNICA